MCAIDILQKLYKDVFPLIHRMLKISVTLLISNASVEKTFSSLRRLTTWFKWTMFETRLTGLALLNIRRNMRVVSILKKLFNVSSKIKENCRLLFETFKNVNHS